jgi:hypothetical protein
VSAIPVRNFRVRRRRSGPAVWLVLDNVVFQLDHVVDAVWGACDGRSSVEAMAQQVAVRLGIPAAEARDLTDLSLAKLVAAGIVYTFEEQHEGPPP